MPSSASLRSALLVGLPLALSSLAIVNQLLARRAERRDPPRGRFVTVDGVRLHAIERGSGAPLLFLHGNGASAEDIVASPVFAAVAGRYRAIALDRPGFGHSERPADRRWTPEAQADLIAAALPLLEAERPIVVGHSWGTLVAVALALRHPEKIRGLVLASGYYFPTPRLDVVLTSAAAMPVAGRILAQTISPWTTRLLWPALLRRLFGPQRVPDRFSRLYSKEMAVRPSQLWASVQEGAEMKAAARRLARSYGRLTVPTVVVAGREDRQVRTAAHTEALAGRIHGARLTVVPHVGHMIHHEAPAAVIAAIDLAA